jgi:subtilisin family serine protease
VLKPPAKSVELAARYGLPKPDIEYTTVLNGFAASFTPQQVSALQQTPSVLKVIPDQPLEVKWEPESLVRFKISPEDREKPPGINRIDAEQQRLNCSAVGIAIVDTGLWKKHQDLNIAGGYNCTGEDPAQWDDQEGHGTSVAEVAAANAENNLGVRGVASRARLFAVKVVGSREHPTAWLSHLLRAVDWISEKAQKKEIQLANMSLQIYHNEPPKELDEAIDRSIRKYNVTYIVAAGNERTDARKNILTRHPEVIVVSAMADTDGRCGGAGKHTSRGERDDSFAADSNFGSVVTLAAPGVDILTTGLGGDYQSGRKTSGTSMAAPHVTGVAALYLIKYRQEHAGQDPTPRQVKEALRTHAVPPSRDCSDPNSGDGGYHGDQSPLPPLVNARGLSPAPPSPMKGDRQDKRKGISRPATS